MRDMTQEELAEKMNVSSQAVSKWENDLSIPDLPILVELADLFGVSLDDLVRQEESTPAVQQLPKAQMKPINQMCLRIVVDSADGDKVRVNLPMSLFKAMRSSNGDFNSVQLNGHTILDMKGVDWDSICSMIENGVIGKLVEVDSSDGDRVEIFVE